MREIKERRNLKGRKITCLKITKASSSTYWLSLSLGKNIKEMVPFRRSCFGLEEEKSTCDDDVSVSVCLSYLVETITCIFLSVSL